MVIARLLLKAMKRWTGVFEKIKRKAEKLRAIRAIENISEKNADQKLDPEKLWLNGEYTQYNRENN